MLQLQESLATRALQNVSDALDIPDEVYEDTILKYEDVADHLADADSDLLPYEPSIYAQGSFRIGTVVQPISADGDYDVDLVCRLELTKELTTQSNLKEMIGDRLKLRDDLRRMLQSKRRCWSLNFAPDKRFPGFHMDILPSIPNPDQMPTGILLTDKKLRLWQTSNPIEYANWFRSRMEAAFEIAKAALAETLEAEIEDIPVWKVKTPLQRSVQMLKRHRDLYFKDESDLKPASIIITTLAAHAYNNERNVYAALKNISQRMSNFIEFRDGMCWIASPVDAGENFADKWNEKQELYSEYQKWHEKLLLDLGRFERSENLPEAFTSLGNPLGWDSVEKAAEKSGVAVKPRRDTRGVFESTVPPLADDSHAQVPNWNMALHFDAKIAASVFKRKGGRSLYPLDKPVPPDLWLRFKAETNCSKPYTIKWQVTNTGEEAIVKNGLRGEFYDSNDDSPVIRWEATEYKGTHWIQAFVIKDNICVACSKRKFVRIR